MIKDLTCLRIKRLDLNKRGEYKSLIFDLKKQRIG